MPPTASQAFQSAGSGSSVLGWKLDPEQRTELLQQFPPQFAHVVAQHVTLKPRASSKAPLPGETIGEIVGRATDNKGVEAMVVRIDGTTERPGGGTFHVTWSLGEGRRPKESNDVLAAGTWEPIALPMPVRLVPACFR
ncbi:MAG TPA: hypothetical protein VF655_09405 [Allosphingosinicella sp.]|jgi:hypothetical protein